MTPERWQQVKTLLQSSLAREPAERSAFLARVCGADQALLAEVMSLISSHERVGSFIESPAFEVMAESLANNGTVLTVGDTLGHYKILQQLGTGGMGEVYLTEDTRLGRKVALKLLPAFFTRDDERVRRFQQEARAASALNHPNILTIYEIGQVDSHHFIATEFIAGETLRRHLTKAPLPLGNALDIASQVALALAAAHQTGIVHRDIKPENIMLRHDALVKVVDFGLAKLLEPPGDAATIVNTNQGVVMGTAHYMSPEQARGLSVDERTDLWSLGVVLYEMLGGCVPFGGETSSDVIVSILEREPAPLGQFTADVSHSLQSIITRALQKDREQRYQSAKELVSDLMRLKHTLETEDNVEAAPQGIHGSPVRNGEPVRTRQLSTRKRLSTQTEDSSDVAGIAGKSHRRLASSRFNVLAASSLLILLASAASYFLFWKTSGAKPAVAVRSIAVLPFKPLVAERPDESLQMGMADTLITRLSGLRQVTVRPISSVRRYSGLEQDPIAAGGELQVDAVLEGSIQWDEDKRIRVTARLWRVSDRSLMWTGNWVEQRSDIFALEDLITDRMARSIEPALTGEEKKLLAKHYTENVEAYQLYLKGRYQWNRRTAEGFTQGIEYFNQAIAKDPQYALAYAGLADSYILLSVGDYGVLAPKDVVVKAKESATRALELDDTLAEAHTSLGFFNHVFDWNWMAAETHFRRAIELNPNYATAHHWYALFLVVQGRAGEAIPEIQRALQVDPRSPILNTDLGTISYYAHQFDAAIEQLKKTLELEPDFAVAHWRLGLTYVQKGKLREADSELHRALDLSPRSPVFLSALGYVAALSGRKDEAQRILRELHKMEQERYVLPNLFANIHLALNEKEQAIIWLQRAYEDRCSIMIGLKAEPLYDPLRSDPRFRDLLKRVGF